MHQQWISNYSNDTTAAVPGAQLSIARRGPGASSARENALPECARGIS